MKRLFALGLALCLLLAACHQRGNDIVIEGDFTHGDNALVRLSWTSPDGTVVLDSVKMKNGHFCFTLRATDDESRARNATPMLYRLDLGHNNAITTIAQGGEHLRFTADATNLVRTYRVSGGEEALLCCQLDSALSVLAQQAEEWYPYYQKNIENDSIRARIEARYMELVNAHTAYLVDFIQHHPQNMASYMAFYQQYNRRVFLDREKYDDLLRTLTQTLKQQYPDSPYILMMERRMERMDLQKQLQL